MVKLLIVLRQNWLSVRKVFARAVPEAPGARFVKKGVAWRSDRGPCLNGCCALDFFRDPRPAQ